ncbi:PREDICTED: uncharacterized protein LOC109239176 [Nicotiana attenuata]|uniref:uncharacterized protein LOC109239176 n=1 Tax=Nicotiana attenuata TaxID=49451 RepID=UPI000905A3B0|nr:PREDICTED: uncharacterized protein LOC109239176 [Nicotiana attenuata]
MPHTDKTGKALKDIDITRISDAVPQAPPEVQIQIPAHTEIPDSQTPISPQATPSVALPAISRLGLLAQHANAKVDCLLKDLPTLIRQALTPIQSSVTALQQQQTSYEDRLKLLEVRIEKIEQGEVGGLPMLPDDVATLKTELHKMQNPEFDLSSFMPKEGEQGAGTSVPGLDFDFSTLMTSPAPQIVGASQTPVSPSNIDIPSGEDSGHSTESESGETDEGETDEESESEEDEGPQEKGKQVAAPTVAEEEQADVQKEIEHSLADMVVQANPSTTQPSASEASSSQTPAPVSGQLEIPPPSLEVTPQAKISSVPASASEGDPTIIQPASDSHSA